MSHPVVGNSWEGFIIENLIDENNIHGYRPYFYRTQRGAEIDLLLIRGGVPEIAIEVKRSVYPKAEKGFHIGCECLGHFTGWADARPEEQRRDVL